MLEFETDKINAEVEAPVDGIVRGITALAGEAVKVQGVCAWVLADGEQLPRGIAPVADAPPPAIAPAEAVPSPVPTAPAPVATGRTGRLFASPLARRIARDNRIDLAAISGSGPSGRIVADDVRANIVRAPADVIHPPQPAMVSVDRVDRAPQGYCRADDDQPAANGPGGPSIVKSTPASWSRCAPNWPTNTRPHWDFGFPITTCWSGICARALLEHPHMQSQLVGGELTSPATVNIGLAIDAPDGLVVPNVKDLGGQQLLEIAKAYRELIATAQAGTLNLEQVYRRDFYDFQSGGNGCGQFHPGF